MEEKRGLSLEERILESAKSLFFEKGFFEAKTRNIATSAGTSESGLFRIFDNKYNILMAVYNACWRTVNEEIDKALTGDSNIDVRMKIMMSIDVLWGLYEKDPLTVAFIIMNTGNTDTLIVERKTNAFITDENVKYIDHMQDLCNKCVRERLVAKTLTERSLCEGVLGISEGVLLGWYLADKAQNTYQHKISKDQAMELLKLLLYGELKT